MLTITLSEVCLTLLRFCRCRDHPVNGRAFHRQLPFGWSHLASTAGSWGFHSLFTSVQSPLDCCHCLISCWHPPFSHHLFRRRGVAIGWGCTLDASACLLVCSGTLLLFWLHRSFLLHCCWTSCGMQTRPCGKAVE